MVTGGQDHRPRLVRWVLAHPVDLVFAALAAGWLAYALRITGELYLWSDDLLLIDQAGSFGGLFEPYNGHMSLVILLVYRTAAELGGLSYTPIMVVGAVTLLAVPVSYYATTRRSFGPPLAGLLALPLLWYDGMSLRPAGMNHYLALVGGIVCAAALDRGRRADWILAAALGFSLCSAGGGLVVAGACVLHNVLVRPHRRRWIAVLVPIAVWVTWWVLAADAVSPKSRFPLSGEDRVRAVRDLCLSPFYSVGSSHRLLAYLLMAAFALAGAAQLRRGIAAGANFLTWAGAMVAWAVALVQSRGVLVDVHTFRYTYLALGFALLAVVPRQPISWPAPVADTNRRWLAVAAALLLVIGAGRGLAARADLQEFAGRNAALGREAEGTMFVLDLGRSVILNRTPIIFYGFSNQGRAGQLRGLVDRYGAPFETVTTDTIDDVLVDRGLLRTRFREHLPHPGCAPLTAPLEEPGTVTPGLGTPPPGTVVPAVPPVPPTLWSAEPFTVEVRRFGEDWVPLVDVPAGVEVVLTLPAMNTDVPWQVQADGACDVRP